MHHCLTGDRAAIYQEVARLHTISSVKSFIPLIARRRVKQHLQAKNHKTN